MPNRLEILDGLLHHKAEQHFFELVDAPRLSFGRELLMRNTEKVSQLFGVIEPEKMRASQHHEHCEGDAIALAKLLVKDGEKRHCSRDPGFDMDMASDHFYTTGSNRFSRGANDVWTG